MAKLTATQMVTVSLLQPMGYRPSKDAEVIKYPMGIVQMPLEHAQAMRVLSRIVSVDAAKETPVLPFGGAFNDKLTRTLEDAGYHTLADLAAAEQDTLLALGIGPANYERIQNALKGN